MSYPVKTSVVNVANGLVGLNQNTLIDDTLLPASIARSSDVYTKTESDNGFLKLNGTSAMTGNINLNTSYKIVNVANPSSDQDVSTKNYTDSTIASSTYSQLVMDWMISNLLNTVITNSPLTNTGIPTSYSSSNTTVTEWSSTVNVTQPKVFVSACFAAYADASSGNVSYSLMVNGTAGAFRNHVFNNNGLHQSISCLEYVSSSLSAGNNTFAVRVNDTSNPNGYDITTMQVDGNNFCTMRVLQIPSYMSITLPTSNVVASNGYSAEDATVTQWNGNFTAESNAIICINAEFTGYTASAGITAYSLLIDDVAVSYGNFYCDQTSTHLLFPAIQHTSSSISSGPHTIKLKINDTSSPIAKSVNLALDSDYCTFRVVQAPLHLVKLTHPKRNFRCTSSYSGNNAIITDFTSTISVTKRTTTIHCQFTASCGSNDRVSYALLIDDVEVSYRNHCFGYSSKHITLPALEHTENLSAGNHTIKVRINSTTSTVSKVANMSMDTNDFGTIRVTQY